MGRSESVVSASHRQSAILRMKKNLGDDSLRREGLGIWDETTVSSAIDPRLWANGTVETRADGGVISFCINMSPDRIALAIGACMKYLDGTAHIELAEYRDTKKHGTAWTADWIAQRWPKTAAVVIDAQSPAIVLLPELKSRGVKVMVRTPLTAWAGVRPRIGHADRRHAEASIRCGSAPIGHGGGERDHKDDRQKRRVQLEQDGIRHRHLAIGSLHDGIAGSVDHALQPKPAAARHALEGKDDDMADEGIWSAAVKRPLDVNSLSVTGIDGVADEDMPMIGALCKVWRDRYPYNLIRQHTRLPFSPEA